MRSRGQNRNLLRPICLNSEENNNRPPTASFFFQEPKLKRTLNRLSTEPSSFNKNFKKSRFCRYTSKTNTPSLYQSKQSNVSCLSKSQNITQGLELGDILDWNQGKEKPVKLRKTNTRIGSILRALRGQLADRFLFRDFQSIQKVAVLGTKIL